MNVIYKYAHLGCMLKIFAHGTVHGQNCREVTIADRDRVEVGEPKDFT